MSTKNLILEIEFCYFLKIFLRFWPFEPHFIMNFFIIKNVYVIIAFQNLIIVIEEILFC